MFPYRASKESMQCTSKYVGSATPLVKSRETFGGFFVQLLQREAFCSFMMTSLTAAETDDVSTVSVCVCVYVTTGFSLILETHIECKEKRHYGDVIDGGWDVCVAEPYRPKNDDCLVYSFGSVVHRW